MARKTFEHEISRLETELLSMGHLVQHSLGTAVDGLTQRNLELSREVIADDAVINSRRYDIEMEALKLIATQQPMASDLRVLAAVIAIASELERIHDYAKGIGKISLLIGERPLMKRLIDLPRMAQKAQGMLHRAMLAFSRRDLQMARVLPREDDEVDALYDQIYREIFTYVLLDSQWLTQANYLIWAAHNLERTADRVTNICERIVFTVTGELVELGGDEEFDSPFALEK